MHLHIIIPVVNEAENLRRLLPYLREELNGRGSITVACGGSTDDTAAVMAANPDVRLLSCTRCGRAQQMNEAAGDSQDPTDVFYFVHADTRPPEGFVDDITEAVAAGYPVGCYRFRFDTWHPLLKINAFFTRFNWLPGRGGDQSLYVTREVFEQLEGFRDMKIMEDYDIIQRVWAADIPFRIIPRAITVSARKYRANNWLRVQLANWKVFRMYKAGAAEDDMIALYRSRLRPW